MANQGAAPPPDLKSVTLDPNTTAVIRQRLP
ncbi:hypothetical protein ACVWZK_002008 [Bradyrhizobium sp. GM0.4]